MPATASATSVEPTTATAGTGLRVIVALSIGATIAANGLANALPSFGRATGEVSATLPTLVTPAGYVFAIWGLIYVGLIAYAAAQFIRPLATDPLPGALAWPLLASGAANVVWLLLWHSLNIGWSVLLMLVLLGSLITAYRIARSGRPGSPSALEVWAVRAPLGLYLGWISVATIANIAGALVFGGWDGWGVPAEWWGVIVLAVGAALAFAMLAREADSVYAAVFVWAYAGIAVATSSDLVRIVASVLAGAIAVGIVVSALVRRRLV